MFDPTHVDQDAFRGYGPSRLPSRLDKEVSVYVDDLRRGGPRRIVEATERASERGRRVLRAYAERMASLAVREVDPDLLVRALIALTIGGLAQNERESMMVMSLIENSAKRLELDLESLFEQVSSMVGHQGTAAFAIWLRRSQHDRSLSAMKFVESADEGGFRYKLEW
jgi:hypothetical protein